MPSPERALLTPYWYLIALQGIFATAIREGCYPGEIPVKVTWPQKRDKVATYLSKDEVERLLKHVREIDATTYLFIVIAVRTGMPKDEVSDRKRSALSAMDRLISVRAARLRSSLRVTVSVAKDLQPSPRGRCVQFAR